MNPAPRPRAVRVLLGLLAAEFILVAAAAAYLVVELVVATPASMATAIALTVLTVLAAVWVALIVIGMWNGAAWTRSGGIVWQILQFAVGIGALQGALAQPVWGWPLVGASIAGIVLLLSSSVGAWTRGDRGSGE